MTQHSLASLFDDVEEVEMDFVSYLFNQDVLSNGWEVTLPARSEDDENFDEDEYSFWTVTLKRKLI